MRKTLERRCIELTQAALTHYMQLDVEYMISLCSEDVLFVPPEQGRLAVGTEAIREDHERYANALVPSHISQAKFEVVQNCGDACSVVGRYLVTTDEGVEAFLQVLQRCQFTWERQDGKLRIKCIFVSNAADEVRAASRGDLTLSMGKMARRYIEARIAAQNDRRRLVFTEVEGGIRFVALKEIIWVGAQRKHTQIHTVSGDYQARLGLSEVVRSLGDDFVSVHRSFVVNPAYVAAVDADEVVMTDGTRIHVPEKRRANVVKALTASVS